MSVGSLVEEWLYFATNTDFYRNSATICAMLKVGSKAFVH